MIMSTYSEQERRNFYRIQDQVGLSYSTLTEAEFLSGAYRNAIADDPFILLSELNKLDTENYVHLRNLSHHQREIAEYFDVINRKIRLLARAIMSEDEKSLHSPTHEVNISAGGISFPTAEILTLETLLDMRIVLFPSMMGIQAIAKIIHVTADCTSEPNWVSAQFVEIGDADQQALVKHVLRRQSEALKSAREAKELSEDD
jgi:PilZ domain